MSLPSDRHYAHTHEWAREHNDEIEVGITDYAQEQLGDVVFVGDVVVGKHVQAGDTIAVVESIKAASDIYAPVSGVITAFNEGLGLEPERLNEAAFDAWILRMRPDDPKDLGTLLDAASYQQTTGG